MIKNQEDINLQLEKLTILQKKTSHAVFLFLRILGLILILTLANLGISLFWLNGRIKSLESELKNKDTGLQNLDNKIKELENKISSEDEQNKSESQPIQTERSR